MLSLSENLITTIQAKVTCLIYKHVTIILLLMDITYVSFNSRFEYALSFMRRVKKIIHHL